MKNDDLIGIAMILGIIAIALFGGNKTAANNRNVTPTQKQASIEKQIKTAQTQVDQLQKEVQKKEEKKTHSKYYGIVHLQNVNRSSDPKQEYLTLSVDSNSTTTIPLTGWKIQSVNSGQGTSIPTGTYLFFAGMQNTESDIYLTGGDTVYLVTGTSPLGFSFKVNKCSEYHSQFQNFAPYLYSNCPVPQNENLSSIPNQGINDACFDYINSLSACRVQTDPLPRTFSAECIDFITNKLTYNSCVNTHKGDKDFNSKKWYVYLRRSDSLWKSSREQITLYDMDGKIVDSIKY